MASDIGKASVFAAAWYNAKLIRDFLLSHGIEIELSYISGVLFASFTYLFVKWLRWMILRRLLTYHGNFTLARLKSYQNSPKICMKFFCSIFK